MPADVPVYLSFFLPPSNPSTLFQLAAKVGSGAGRPLTREQVLSMFAPTPEEFDRVVQFLESQGFSIVYESPDRFSVEACAPASTVESVFHTKLYTYRYQGEIYYAPLTPPQIPGALGGLQIVGLTNRTLVQPQYIVLGRLNGQTLSKSDLPRSFPEVGLGFAATYYGPGVLEGAYGVDGLLSQGYAGRGQSIAIIDAFGDPTIYEDLAAFDREFGLPPVNLTIVPIGPYHPEQGVFTGWDVETALDVEAAHAMAPNAHIYLVVASNAGNALFEAIDYVVSLDLANVTSMSWGLPENLIGQSGFYYSGFLNYPYADYYFALGVAEGITFFASSGDEGAYGGTPTTYGGVLFPASSPFVTAVGGTTLYVDVTSGSIAQKSAKAKYGYEEAWSVSPDYSGATVSSGGGYSTLFPKPWYQASVDGSSRGVPDVAADANPFTGMVTIVEGQTFVVGGTSLASPLWAGMTAILDEYLGRPLGLLNQYLYEVYANKTLYDMAFHQVVFGYNGAYYASEGYNTVTGLGTPNLPGLAEALEELPPQLEVSVTLGGSGTKYPQFTYGSTVTVAAAASYPNGTSVTTGSFTATVYSLEGAYTSLALSYNGSAWVGSFTVGYGAPPNTWSVVVKGVSGGYVGYGAADLEVGLSVAIFEPVPYPFGPPIPPNQPFTVEAAVTYPDGTPVDNATVVAVFEKGGRPVFNVSMIEVASGVYAGQYALLPNVPQGVYNMVVRANISGQVGEAYTYEYFGEALLFATIITPTIDALPSASPGQNITLYTLSLSAAGDGIFTSNVSVEFYSPNGSLAAKVYLKPAPNTVVFGFLNLFFAQEANFTIPQSFAPGFYTVVFNSTYKGPSGTEHGEYVTALYVSPNTLGYHVRTLSEVFEGETVSVEAEIVYPNGTPVTRGVFMVTALPVNYNYVAFIFQSSTGVPMQYDASRGVWLANFTYPSVLSGGFYQGLAQSYLSGPWAVELTGEGPGGLQAQQSQAYVDVLPYTYLSYHSITPSNLSYVALAANASGTPTLAGVGLVNLTVSGVALTVTGSYVVGLVAVGSNITIAGSTIRGLTLINSSATLIGDTVTGGTVGVNLTHSTLKAYSTTFRNLTYAYSPVDSEIEAVGDSYVGVTHLSTLPEPSFSVATPTTITHAVTKIAVNVTGSQLKAVGAYLNGVPVAFAANTTAGGLTVYVPFDSKANPDGAYTVTVVVSSGLQYTYTFSVVNLYHEQARLNFQQSVDYVLGGLGVVGLAVALTALTLLRGSRRGGPA